MMHVEFLSSGNDNELWVDSDMDLGILSKKEKNYLWEWIKLNLNRVV